MDAAAAKALVEKSGNSFQCRVANYFEANEWAVLLSPYYVDASTDTTRETDLIVEKDFQVQQRFRGNPRTVRLRLFVECKYVIAGAVFWMAPMDLFKAQDRVLDGRPFIRDHVRNNEHHYFQTDEPVSKLFASEKSSKADDLSEREPVYKALNQCLNGFLYNRGRASLLLGGLNKEVTTIDYPVIAFSSFNIFLIDKRCWRSR